MNRHKIFELRKLMNRIYFNLLAAIILSTSSFPFNSNMYIRGTFNSWSTPGLALTSVSLPDGTANWVWDVQTLTYLGSGLQYKFASSSDWSVNWGGSAATLTAINLNTSTTLVSFGSNLSFTPVSGKYYLFTIKDAAATVSTPGLVLELGGTPATINSVTTSAPNPGTAVTITANLNGPLVSNQTIWLRYSINSKTYTTSTITQMTGNGTTFTATIPSQDSTAGVYYYCFTSGTISGGITTGNITEATINKSVSSSYGNLSASYNWWDDQVFYELFVRSFYDGDGNGIGDFSGLMQKLNYLNTGKSSSTSDLGITALWLMPIMQSPSYHGYDITDYKTIEQDYGTNLQFKAFLDSAHAHGIKVIIDLVLNHTSNQHPWFVNSESGTSATYRNWYIWNTSNPGFTGPWGEQVWFPYGGNYYYGVFNSSMPDLNYFNSDVKSTIAGIVDYWLDTVKVDGFRLDGAKYICEEGTVLQEAPSTFAYWREFRNLCKSINPKAMNVGEVWSSTSIVQQYVDGTGLDFCFEFDTATDIISAINGGNPSAVKNQIDNVVTKNYPFLQYGTFLTNHDQMRIYSQLGSNTNYSKLAASLLLTLPGIPFLYYGEEIGMTSASDDPSKRTPMQWTSGTNAGFTAGSPWEAVNSNYTTHNVLTMNADSTSLLGWYKKLIRIRKLYPSLRRGEYLPMSCSNSNVYAFGRNYIVNNDTELVFPVHNFTSSTVTNPVLTYSGSSASGCIPGTYSLTDLLTYKSVGQLIIQSDGSISFTPSISISANSSAIIKADFIQAPLPVDLYSFTAHHSGNRVILNWETISELNNNVFEVERSSVASAWVRIGTIPGAGNSNSNNNYSFTDSKLPGIGRYFYRLKQIDNSGQYKYSNTAEIIYSAPLAFSLSQNYPNPFNPNTTINYSLGNAGHILLNVYNSIGSKVATLVDENEGAGNYSIQFNGSNLASGIYLYRLESGNFSSSKKFILIK